MILKHHALLGELKQRGSVLFTDEIGPHAVPHHEDDVFRFAGPEQQCRMKRDKKPERSRDEFAHGGMVVRSVRNVKTKVRCYRSLTNDRRGAELDAAL
jgi:hypothetical protein